MGDASFTGVFQGCGAKGGKQPHRFPCFARPRHFPRPFEFRHSFAYDGRMGEMKRREAHEADQRTGSRYVSTLVIAAAIITAVRLAREEIGRPSPRIAATISDSITLARSLLEGVLRRYPG